MQPWQVGACCESILSGILEAQYPEVKACYEKLGLREIAYRLIEGWASGCFSRA